MAKRIVLTGGLSGGHTFPLIAVAREVRSLTEGDVDFLFLGSRGPFEESAMHSEGIRAKYLLTAKWRRYFSLLNYIDIFKFPIACLQALWHLLWFMPDVIFSKGGAASVPIAIAAWVYRIPILLHDSDAVAGRANRWVARFAKRIAIAYEHARQFFPSEKVMLTGNPVRGEILTGDASQAPTLFGFDLSKPIVVVMGGSLGARALNRIIIKMLPELLEQGVQVLHLVGQENTEEVIRLAEEVGITAATTTYRPVAFLNATEMGVAYAAATLVISRAGAGSITELAATKKPTILVPLPTAANDEQRLNAYEVASTGGAIVIEEANVGEHLFTAKILELLNDEAKRQAMSAGIHRFYHPEAARLIAEGLISLY